MNDEDHVQQMMTQLFIQARAQFGGDVRSYWFYDGHACPGCGQKVDHIRFKGKKAVSLNAYIYRERGVLIGYRLCGRCARAILRDAERSPGQETERHITIEAYLINAYLNYSRSLSS